MLILIALAAAAEHARGEPPQLSQEIATLLQQGWSNLPGAMDESRRRYDLAVALAPGDGRPDLAFGLVLLRRRQFDAAMKHFDGAVTSDRANLAAWRGGFWLAVYRGDTRGAMIRMKALLNLYPRTKARPDVETQLIRTAEWMGAICGYLAGPAGESVDAEMLDALQRLAAERLTGERGTVFDKARREVRDKHERLLQELGESTTQDQQDAAKSQQLEHEYIETEKQRLADELVQLEDKTAQTKVDFDTKVAEIDEELKPLAARYQELLREAFPLKQEQRDLEDLLKDIRDAGRRAQGGQLEQLREAAERASRKLEQIDEQLEPIEKEGKAAEKQITKLNRQRAEAINLYQQTMRMIGIQRRKLLHTERMLGKSERSLGSGSAADTPRVRKLREQVSSIATYRTYPLEQVKQELLDTLE